MVSRLDSPLCGESFRSLRRGLARSDGFALFIAVCNRPIDRDALIEALAESMPDAPPVIVRVDAKTIDLLHETSLQAETNPLGPLMLVDLEKAVPSVVNDHAVLRVLNLQRPKWPVQIARPVVFWVADYLFTLLCRESPDFVDWRSDTFFFSELTDIELRPLQSEPWQGGLDGRLTEPERRARIRELRSRLTSALRSNHPFVLSTHADWLNELGKHLELLGEFDEAERLYLQALAIYETLGRRHAMANAYGNIGGLYQVRRDLGRAETMLCKALEIEKALGHWQGVANVYRSLGGLNWTRGDLDQAEAMVLKALELNEGRSNREGMAKSFESLGLIYQTRGDLDRAVEMIRKGLEIEKALGRQQDAANSYGNLGLIYLERGDLDQAEAMLRKALLIDEMLGWRLGMARAYGGLALIAGQRGDMEASRALLFRSQELFNVIGIPRASEGIGRLLDSLTAEPSGLKQAKLR